MIMKNSENTFFHDVLALTSKIAGPELLKYNHEAKPGTFLGL
jgi:hypothetical protein